MKSIASALILILVAFVAACSRQPVALHGCIRFSEIDATHYRLEAGVLTDSGFIASNSNDYSYSDDLHSRSELNPILGKTLVQLSVWASIQAPPGFRRSTQVWTLAGVPFVAVEYTR